ncbi:MAG: heme oxygenase [Solibacillus sp.]
MFTVTNRILVKKGFGQKMAPAFTSSKTLFDFEGFKKVEVNLCTEPEEHDELNVMMYWETLENFQAWRNSDDFRKSHDREKSGNANSPIISNRIVVSEIVSVLA